MWALLNTMVERAVICSFVLTVHAECTPWHDAVLFVQTAGWALKLNAQRCTELAKQRGSETAFSCTPSHTGMGLAWLAFALVYH